MPIFLIIGVIIAAVIGVYAFTQNNDSQPAEPAARTETTTTVDVPTDETVTTDEQVEPEPTAGAYTDGTYSATASYLTPRRTEQTVEVTLTVENDVVTDSVVTFDGKPEGEASNDNQARFADAYTSEVVGMKLDEISLSRVGGASLTSTAFNEAKAKIAAEAA